MARLDQIAAKIRSKNAGPFWLTIDIFCGTAEAFARVRDGLDSAAVAVRLGTGPDRLKRFDIAELSVVKFSLPRPVVQGAIADRDLHGAASAEILAGMEI